MATDVLQGGSITALYEARYAAHAPAVLNYLNHEMRDPETAADVAQDTWLRVHRFLPDVLAAGGDAGKTWLMRLATNAMIDHIRRVKVRPQSRDLEGVEGTTALQEAETPEDVAVAAAEHDEVRATAALLLQLLPRPARLVVWLREWRGYSYEQIAVVLKCTAPAVKTRLWRARAMQRTLWEQERAHTAAGGAGTVTRLWRHVQGGRQWALAHPDECWLWLGNRTRGRPGTIVAPSGLPTGRGTQNPSAVRVLYAAVRGVLPPWAYLSPACPSPACINPAHRRITSKAGPGGVYRAADPGLDRPDAADASWLTAHTMRQRRLALAVTTLVVSREAGCTEDCVGRLERRVLVDPPTTVAIEAALARLEARLTPLTVGTPETLRARRLAAGLTRSQLVALSGISPRSMHRLETSQGTKGVKASSCRRRLQETLDRLERERQELVAS